MKQNDEKANALGCIANYMYLNKRRTLMKTFIEYQFNCFPGIWAFHFKNVSN